MMILRILLGLAIGAVVEFLIIKYTQAIVELKPKQGASTTLGLGLLNLFVVGMLSWGKYVDLPIAGVVGESICNYFVIKHDKNRKKNKIHTKV